MPLLTSRIARFWTLALLSAVVALGVSRAAADVTINVPGGSFESPDTLYASAQAPTGWTKVQTETDTETSAQAGIFENPVVNQPDRIDNLDGTQAGFIFGGPGISLYTDLSRVYLAGETYKLTLGVGGGGGNMSYGTTLELRFFYRTTANGPRIPIPGGATQIVYSSQMRAVDPPPINHLFDFTASVVTQGSDPWANMPIGIEIAGIVAGLDQNGQPGGGYWDVDNVRLVAIPEPSSLLLLGVAGVAMLARRSRGRSTFAKRNPDCRDA